MYSINSKMNKLFKAIGYKARTDIVKVIQDEEEITLRKLLDKFKMGSGTLSFHIQELKNAGIILSQKRKKEVFLKINSGLFIKASNLLQKFSK